MSALNEIEKRHAWRQNLLKANHDLRPPIPTDPAGQTLHKKLIKENNTEFLEACTAIGPDMQCLLMTIREAAARLHDDPAAMVQAQWNRIHVDESTREILNRRRAEEAKARGEIEGQIRMFETAEPASPVVTRKLDE